MPTVRIVDNQRPGVEQVKNRILKALMQGDMDLQALITRITAQPLIRLAVVQQALTELRNEGKIEQV
jgi:hypothetical protein